MGRVEIGGIHVRDKEDIEKILGKSEREFARLIVSKPGLQCWYESTRFEYQNGGPSPEATVPDFRIVNTRSGVEVFVEITTSLFRPDADPKERQKRVMRNAADGEKDACRYVVLYAEHLSRIQSANKGYQFLGHYYEKHPRGNGK